MLQRAASNACSWWWASSIRTKQSKWLDNSLQDMEEKVKSMIKLIDEDADSFAKRAEMYYKRRPELISFVEEAFRSYKALADRYDHISGELHKANHTLSTLFPEQFQNAMQDDSEEGFPKAAESLSVTNKNSMARGKSGRTRSFPSPIDETRAREEIDRLQKDILVLQTEKEFVKNAYERALSKFLDIERRITDMQDEVSYLQDELHTSSEVIEDDEARALMAATALKSCEDALINLQEEQKKSTADTVRESKRIKDAKEKLRALKGEPVEKTSIDPPEEEEPGCGLNQDRIELRLICERIKEHFETRSDTSVVELAEKIDELVDKVINLELTVSSQSAQIERLKSDTDDLQKHLHELEEEKEALKDSSIVLSERLKQAEEKLNKIQDLEKYVLDEKGVLQMHFIEACQSLNSLSEKLRSPEFQNPAENTSSIEQDELSAPPSEAISITVSRERTPASQMGELDVGERIPVDEYTSVLRNYDEVKKRLTEVERKSQDSLFETISQIRELKCANATKDEELRSLRQQIRTMRGSETQSRSRSSSTLDDFDNIPHELTSLLAGGFKQQQQDAWFAKEEKFRREIDAVLEENMNFWLRFSTSYHQIQQFKTTFQGLQTETKDAAKENLLSAPIDRKLRELRTEMQVWSEKNELLKGELQRRHKSISKTQDEISSALRQAEGEGARFVAYQAAKFQGEISNTQQEIRKVEAELQAGLDYVKGLQGDVQKALMQIHGRFDLPQGEGSGQGLQLRQLSTKNRIPLRTFLFGGSKQKKPSIFSCMNPALRKHYNGVRAHSKIIQHGN